MPYPLGYCIYTHRYAQKKKIKTQFTLRNTEKIHFHFIFKEDNNSTSKGYCADLLFNYYELNEITIKLYVDESPYLSAKIDRMIRENEFDKHIEVIKIVDDRFVYLDFSNTIVTGVKFQSNLGFIPLSISQVTYECLKYEIEEVNYHSLYLNSRANFLSPIIYTAFDGRGKWEDKTTREVISLDLYDLVFTNEFYTEKSLGDDGYFTIKYVPLLRISTKKEIDDKELREIGDFICLLASFYIADYIDYSMMIFNKEDRQRILLKKNKYNKVSQANRGSLTTNYRTFKDFILSIESLDNIKSNFDWWKNNVEKLIISTNLDGESKFLILYNIMEQVLRYLRIIGIVQVRSETTHFTGMSSNLKNIKDKCRDLVDEISKFIPSDNKEEIKSFRKQNQNISFLKTIITNNKRLTSSNKLQLILEKLNINPLDCGIEDIKELVKLRDNIVHSNREITENEIKTANAKMFKLSNLVILRLLNSENELSWRMRKKNKN